jgi:peptide/nickel transport system substrate-binding protein
MRQQQLLTDPLARGFTRADFMKLGAISAAGLALPGLAACGEEGAAGAKVELTLAGIDAGLPNPFGYLRGPGYAQTMLIYDSLIWKDGSGEYIPWLATKWETTDKGKSWTFQLRDDVKWQDGQKFTARDVAFTFNYLLEHEPPPGVVFRPIAVKGATAQSDTVVVVELEVPYAGFLQRVAGSQPILPEHIWKDVADPAKFTGEGATMGTGPYVLKEYARGEGAYLFTANDDFFLGKPYVQQIAAQPVGDPLVALSKGAIDAGGPQTSGRAAKQALDTLRANKAYKVVEGPPDVMLSINFNLDKAPMNNPAFRRAVAYAINRGDLVKRALQGAGLPGNPGFFPPSSPWYSEVRDYPFSPEQANAELERGGIQTPVKVELLFSPETGARPAELVKSYLAKVGIQLDMRPVDRATQEQRSAKGRYEMVLLNSGGLGGDADYMRVVYVPPPGNQTFQSLHGYENKEFKKLAKAQSVAQDAGKRGQLVDRMQAIAARDVPMLPLFYPYGYWGFKPAEFDAWYYTPGGFGAGVPQPTNKHVFVTGKKTGTAIKGT